MCTHTSSLTLVFSCLQNYMKAEMEDNKAEHTAIQLKQSIAFKQGKMEPSPTTNH